MSRALLLSVLIACGGSSAPAPQPAAPAQPAPAPAAEPGHGHQHGHGHGHGHAEGKHPAPLGHRFENAEEWAARFDQPDRDAWQKPAHVVELMTISEGMSVADIGAGTGYFMPHLSRAVGASGAVHSLDIEPDMVRYMTERARRDGLGNVTARVVKTDDPGLSAGSVDRVLIVNTWHHIPKREAYAGKLAAALRDGGAVYIVDYTLEAPRGPPRDHRLAPEQVVRELTAGGLTAEIMASEQLDYQYVVVARAAAE